MPNGHAYFFESKKIGNTYNVEGLLCLATLIATDSLDPSATIHDAVWYYENATNEDCTICPHNTKCLACIINE